MLEGIADGVAVLTLNRPERLNAMSDPMLDGLLEALPRLAEDSAVGVVVLTGAGRGFCAGGDVKAMAEGSEMKGVTLEERAHGLRARMEVSRWLHEMPKPTIAMVRGAAAGAGLSLAMACDLRIAGDSARFGTAFARVGYSGDFGGSFFLTQLVGKAKARELYYTADLLDAQQALACGLVNRVIPDARLEEETLGLAARIAGGPRIALRYMKRNLNAAETGTLTELLRGGRRSHLVPQISAALSVPMSTTLLTPDAVELSALLEQIGERGREAMRKLKSLEPHELELILGFLDALSKKRQNEK